MPSVFCTMAVPKIYYDGIILLECRFKCRYNIIIVNIVEVKRGQNNG